jgi:hypothetical protein
MFSVVRALVRWCIDTFHKANLLTPSNKTIVTKGITIGCMMYKLNNNVLLRLPSVILEQMSQKTARKKDHCTVLEKTLAASHTVEVKESKTVPLLAMQALMERGGTLLLIANLGTRW